MTEGWLVTGAAGMLGVDLTRLLGDTAAKTVALDRTALDITDREAVDAAISGHRPAVVVNCAAWTAVDDAEAHEADATRINGDGAANVAAACAATGAVMLHLSTDYVFGGDASTPYRERDETGPSTAYGRSKLAGETAVLAALPDTGYVIRTAWLYGAHGANFVRTMIKLEAARDTVDVVDDQHGQPTWTVDLAGQVIRLGEAALTRSARPGVYHGTSGGACTWFELARETFDRLGADPDRVRPTTSAAFVRPAPRPAFSVLAHDRWRDAGISPIRDWRAALADAFPALVAAERG